MSNPMEELYQTVLNRKAEAEAGSYTGYLFGQGLDKILKKCGEECSEVLIAAKNNDRGELIMEISDLLYHLTVLMVQKGITVQDIAAELAKRHAKTNNLKQFHNVDKNT